MRDEAILLFGGTTEGRQLAALLAARGARVAVSVATPLGAEMLAGTPGISVLVGRRDAAGMAALLSGARVCIDATHPYAAEAHRNLRAACAEAGVPLLRLRRADGAAEEGVLSVSSCAQAAAFLAQQAGNVLLATGSKELAAFSCLAPERVYARVLPTHEALSVCEALGLAHGHILAMQGPFSQKLNEAILEQYAIAWLVTKDGGAPGGYAEKAAAARAVGARLLLVRRPADEGLRMEEILQRLEEMFA